MSPLLYVLGVAFGLAHFALYARWTWRVGFVGLITDSKGQATWRRLVAS